MRLRYVVSALSLTLITASLTACSTTSISDASASGAATGRQKAVPPDDPRTIRGFVWSSDLGLEVIPLPSYATSMNVMAMNNSGQVVGYVTVGEGSEQYRAFFWSRSSGFKAIGSLAGPNGISMASSIDDAGVVRGVSEGPSTVWNGPMGVVLQDNFSWTEAAGIQASSRNADAPNLATISRNLVLPSGADCSHLIEVNARGQALGYAGSIEWKRPPGSVISTPECIDKSALVWEPNGTFSEIGTCGPRSECELQLAAINGRGEVIGYSASAGGFRWTASSGFVRIPMDNSAVSLINDNGDAAGTVTSGDITSPLVWMSSGELRTIQLPAGATYGYPVTVNARMQVAGNLR